MVKREFKQPLILAVTFLALITSTVAQEAAKPSIAPAKRALIAELLDVTESRRTATEVYQGMLDQQGKLSTDVLIQTMENKPEFMQLSDQNKELVRTEILENSARTDRRVKELIDERVNFQLLIEEISYELYDKYFTEDELRDLVGFYKSPTGKKAIAVTPKLFTESMELARVAIQPKLIEVITIFSKEESDRLKQQLEVLMKETTVSKPVRRKPRTRKPRRP